MKKDEILLQEAYKQIKANELLNECVSVSTLIDGKYILCKNRDRCYYPKLKIVREIINGIECAYMYDIDTDYAEGMNAEGIGILNTTLTGKEDEKEGTDDKKRENSKLNEDGHKIRTALGYSDIRKIAKILDLYHRGLGGHTVIGHKDGLLSIEKLSFGKPKFIQHDKNEIVVRANHGIAYPDQGYQHGDDRESTLSRVFFANKDARMAKTPEDLLRLLRTHRKNVLGYLEPYRTNYKVWTSSQIMLNLTDLRLTFVVDENVEFAGIENRLPKGYVPKIEVEIAKLETVFNVHPVI